MDQEEIIEHRYRFFAEQGVALTIEHTKTFITLFTAIIAGLIVLVLDRKVGYWTGVFFLAASFMALWGVAFSVLHLNFAAKLMLLYAAYFASEDETPNILEPAKPTLDQIRKIKQYSQNAFVSQITKMFFTVFFAVVGLSILLWDQVEITGLILAAFMMLTILLALFFGIWLRRYRVQKQDATTNQPKGS